jgi:hypothetical protein
MFLLCFLWFIDTKLLYNHGGEKEAELPFTLILKYRKQIKPLLSMELYVIA